MRHPRPLHVNILSDARPEIVAPINDSFLYAIGPDGRACGGTTSRRGRDDARSWDRRVHGAGIESELYGVGYRSRWTRSSGARCPRPKRAWTAFPRWSSASGRGRPPPLPSRPRITIPSPPHHPPRRPGEASSPQLTRRTQPSARASRTNVPILTRRGAGLPLRTCGVLRLQHCVREHLRGRRRHAVRRISWSFRIAPSVDAADAIDRRADGRLV
jgi:hypothetical protein